MITISGSCKRWKQRLHQSACYAHGRLSASRWWCPSVSQSWGNANAADIRRSCSEDQRRILSWCASHSTATACHAGDLWRLLHLAARQCSSSPRTRHNQTSWTGDTRVHCTIPLAPTVQILTQWTTRYGAKCSSGSTRQKFMTWMNWNNVLSMSSMAWDKTSLMPQLMSGANVCVRVFVPKEDILSIYFDSRGTHMITLLCELSLWILKENCCYCVKMSDFCYFDLLYFTR